MSSMPVVAPPRDTSIFALLAVGRLRYALLAAIVPVFSGQKPSSY
jgi:hypothetical protein